MPVIDWPSVAIGFAAPPIIWWLAVRTERRAARDLHKRRPYWTNTAETIEQNLVADQKNRASVRRPYYPAKDVEQNWYPCLADSPILATPPRPALPMRTGAETVAVCEALNDAYEAGYAQCSVHVRRSIQV